MHELLKRYFGKLSDKLVSDKTSLNRRLKQDEVTMDLKVGRFHSSSRVAACLFYSSCRREQCLTMYCATG